MIKILLTFLLVAALPAEDIKLAWDPHPDAVAFRLEMTRPAPWAQAGQWVPVATGIEGTAFTVTAVPAGPISFRIFAYLKASPATESEASAVLQTASELPPPSGLRKVKVAIQASGDMSAWQEIVSVEREVVDHEFFRAVVTAISR